MALFNRGEIRFENGECLKCLDYQFPLKARQGDRGVGKIDLIGITDAGILSVIELKVENSADDKRIGLLEGLIYSAIVEANLDRIAAEVKAERGCDVATLRPVIMLVGPPAFWSNSNSFPPTNDLQGFVKNIEAAVPIEIKLLRLDNSEMIDAGRKNSAPRLGDNVLLAPVLQ